MHPKSHIIHWKWNQMGQYARNGHILTGRTRILSRPRNFYCVGRNSFRVNGFGFTGKLLADILEEDLMENAA